MSTLAILENSQKQHIFFKITILLFNKVIRINKLMYIFPMKSRESY